MPSRNCFSWRLGFWLVSTCAATAQQPVAGAEKPSFTSEVSAFPEDTAWREAFAPVEVRLLVRDAAGRPIGGAQIIGYHEDWGLPFPAADAPFATADEYGQASIRIWPGRCSFMAGAGRGYAAAHPGEAYFLTRTTQVGKNTRVVLEPDRRVGITLPADAKEIYAMESGHVPLVPPPFCGISQNQMMVLYTGKRVGVRLLLIRPPEETPGYILLQTLPPSSRQIGVTYRPSDLHRIHVRFSESPKAGLQPLLALGFPSMALVTSAGFYWVSMPVRDGADVYCSPMVLNYCCAYLGPEGSSYYFQNRSMSLRVREKTSIEFAGIRETKLLAVSDFTTQGGTDLWLVGRGSPGDFLRFYREKGGKEPAADVVLSDESGKTVLSERRSLGGDGLHWRVAQPAEATERLRYRIDWELGPFGRHRLEGKLTDDSTRLSWANVKTAHFDAFFPKHLADRGGEVVDRLERAYDFMGDYVGTPLEKKLRLGTPIHPPTAGQAGGDQILIWLDGFLWWNPQDQINNWEGCLLHELGHHALYYSARAGAPLSGMRNENLASLLAFEALGRGLAEDAKIPANVLPMQWLPQAWYANQWFARFTCGNLRRDSDQFKLWMLYFPLEIYLPKVYGRDIHRRFFRNWIACRKLLKSYREEEAFAATYSFLCGKNLASLFQYAGEEVTPDRVSEGLRLLVSQKYVETK